MMARYDRIARLPPPDREHAFPGWLTLRDLEGREREPELGRRARLRFLALRPVRRLLAHGLEGADAQSFRLQLDAVRAEVERLPAGDPERGELIRYLETIGDRTPAALITATLDIGAAAEAGGHEHAAEEFYLTGVEIAREHDLPLDRSRALRCLAGVLRAGGRWDAALERAREAAGAAEDAGDATEWAMAMGAVAAAHAGRGDAAEGRRVLTGVAERGQRDGDPATRAIAAAAQCALELADDRVEDALRHGRAALDLLAAADPHRDGLLLDMAAAFRRLRLWTAAGACYDVVARGARRIEQRAEASAERALLAAEQGDAEAFRRRRDRLLASIDGEDPRLVTLLHLGLGRGCILVGDVDDAREHLRQAIATARDTGHDTALARADQLLEDLERGRPRRDARTPVSPSPASRGIAKDVEALLAREVVPAG